MNQPEESIEQLKAQINELSQKLQNLAQEKGQKLSDKTDGFMDGIKRELGNWSSKPGQSPYKAAIAALALGLIQEFEPKVKDSLKSATEKTAGLAGNLEEGFAEGLDKTIAASKKAGNSIADYVKENPWKAVALAAVVGMMIGRLAPRETSSDSSNGSEGGSN